jgi:Bacteriophage HK97-gp10, putative tail-component
MPYTGDKIGDFIRAAKVPTSRAAHEMAEEGGEAMRGFIRDNTPVDTGDLRSSWRQKPVIRLIDARGRVVYETGVWTDVEYAEWVERGTGLYGPYHQRIYPSKPGGVLTWIGPDGKRRFAKSIKGMRGAHMVATGVAKTEAEFDSIVRPVLDRWRTNVYASWASGGWR